MRLSKESEDTWVCLDTGAGMGLINRDWLHQNCPDAAILTRTTNVSIRGINNRTQKTSTYVVLLLFVPGHDKVDNTVTLAEIRWQFHIVSDLRCKMIVGEDVNEPEGIVIDSQARKASIKACGDFPFNVRVTPMERQVLHRRVRSSKRVTVPPGSNALIPIKLKPLPGDLDDKFTPVSDKHTEYLARAGGMLRAVVDPSADAVIFRDRSHETITVQKDQYLGYVSDFASDMYHVLFNPDEHPTLFDAALSGLWRRNQPPMEQLGSAMASAWCSDRGLNGFTDPLHAVIATDVNTGQLPLTSEVDINASDDITPAQQDAARRKVQRFASVFEDRGTVAIEP
jgi:hypothetical protein